MISKIHYPPIFLFALAFSVILLVFHIHDGPIFNSLSPQAAGEDLAKRVVGPKADPQRTFQDWATDGEALRLMMEASSPKAAKDYYTSVSDDEKGASAIDANAFTDWSALSHEGWVARQLGKPSPDSLEEYPSAVEFMKIHHDYKTYNLRYRFKHTGNTDEWKHPGTNAEEYFSFNHEDRGIIIEDVEAPAYVKAIKAEKCPPNAQLPPHLNRMSDLMFLGWQHTSEPANNPKKKEYSPKKLEWILVDSIREPYTQNILYNMFKEWKFDPPVARKFEYMADHHAFSTDEGAGALLLGTPLGRIVSWFLIQHKEQLGTKKVTEVVVFSDDDVEDSISQMQTLRTPGGDTYHTPYNPMHLMFFIEDVDDDDVEDAMEQMKLEEGDKGKGKEAGPSDMQEKTSEELLGDEGGDLEAD